MVACVYAVCKIRIAEDNMVAIAEQTSLVIRACRDMEAAQSPPTLKELAARADMSPWQFRRLFVAQTGLTPKAYAAGLRAARVRQALVSSEQAVTQAIYDAGFNASSRFYESSERMLGMPARDYRAGARGQDIRFAIGQCSLGAILVAESPRGICAILMGEDPEALLHELQDRFPQATLCGGDAGFEERVAQVVGLVEAPSLGIDLPLDIQGTAFQERVWRALQAIPAGSTVSYAELAASIGSPTATRAVARACGANLLAVAIPCHRIVRRNGDLGGYRWGVERKRILLEREQNHESVTRDNQPA